MPPALRSLRPPATRPQQAALDQFETLSLGPAAPAAPGQPAMDAAATAAAFPRPAGPGAEEAVGPPPPYAATNCAPQYMRVTSQAVPNSQALKARWHLPYGAGAAGNDSGAGRGGAARGGAGLWPGSEGRLGAACAAGGGAWRGGLAYSGSAAGGVAGKAARRLLRWPCGDRQSRGHRTRRMR